MYTGFLVPDPSQVFPFCPRIKGFNPGYRTGRFESCPLCLLHVRCMTYFQAPPPLNVIFLDFSFIITQVGATSPHFEAFYPSHPIYGCYLKLSSSFIIKRLPLLMQASWNKHLGLILFVATMMDVVLTCSQITSLSLLFSPCAGVEFI